MRNDRQQHRARATLFRLERRVAAWMFLVAFLVLGMTTSAILWGQDAAPAETPDDEARPAPTVEEVKPGVYWVPTAKGTYIKVIDIPFERLRELLQKDEGENRDTPPKYSLEKAIGTGELRDLYCEWSLDFSIRVREPGWIKVPLKLQGMALRSELKYHGPTEAFLSYDNPLHGYVAWIRSTEPGVHRLELTAATSVQPPSQESRMQFEWPRANEATVTVVMPKAVHDPALTSGEGSLTSRAEGEKSIVQIVGASGKMGLGWKDTPTSASTGRSTVDVRCDVTWRIESPQDGSGEASLVIRSTTGSAARTLYVRLPNNSQWLPNPQPLWRAERVALSDLPGSVTEFVPKWSRDAEFLRLSLEPDATDWPAEVRLRVDAKPIANTAPAVFSLDGFDVLGVMKQRGSVEVTAPTTLDVRCSGDESVFRTDSTAVAVTSAEGRSVGSFKFNSQPYQLSAVTARQAARVSCEPAYTVAVEGTQATLEATFKFRVRGVRETPLGIDLAGWVLDTVSPSEAQVLTEEDATATGSNDDRKNKLEIALGTGRETTVRVTARKPIVDGRIEFDVPKLEGTSLTPAVWTIRPDANVVLVPNEKEIRGLSPEHRGSSSAVALVYRENVVGESGHFSAGVRSAVRQLTIARRVQAVANREGLAVEETWDARLSHGTTEELSIQPPTGAEAFSASLQGQVVPNEMVEVDGKPLLRIALGKSPPRDLHLRFTYNVAFPEATEEAPASFELPLAIPHFEGQVRWASGQGYVEWDGPIFLNLTSKPLSRPTVESNRKYRLALSKDDLGESVGLTLSLGAGAFQSSTVIPRAWMQTWLANGSRRDRVVWRFTTDRSRVVTGLDPSEFAETAFLLDGRVVAPVLEGDRLAIELPAQRAFEGTYVLEAWLLRKVDDQSSIDFPVELDDARPRHFLWHLTPPSDRWVLTSPPGFTSEVGTPWPLGIGQPSVVDVDHVERARRWIGLGAPHDEGMSDPRYVFVAFDVPKSIELSLFPARLLAAAIAIGVFVSIWLGIQLRRSLWWFAVALVSVGVLASLQMTLAAPLVAASTVLAALAAVVREVAVWLFGVPDAPATESSVSNSVRNVPVPSNVASPVSSKAVRREAGSSRLGGAPSPVLTSTEGVDANP